MPATATAAPEEIWSVSMKIAKGAAWFAEY